ncbi:MAG: lysylphosphatidylglycerol synthase transmembrane domain-containing protein [Nevskia sp.]
MNQEIDPRGSLKRRRALVLFAALGVVVYMALALATDTDALTSALHKLGWLGSGTVLLLSLLNYGLRCQRWTLYLVRLGHALPGPQLLLCYLGGFAFTVSPAKAGEAVRSLYLRDHGVSYADSIAALFVERLLDLLAMALLAGLVVLDQPAYWPVLVAALAATVGLLLVISQPALPRRLSGLAARRGEHGRRARLLGALASLLRSSQRILQPRLLLLGLALGVVAWGAEGIGFQLICRGLDFPLAAPVAAGIYALAALGGGAAFFLPGGIGGMEVIMTALLVAHGAPLPIAVVATLLCRLATLWFAVLIGLCATALLETRPRGQAAGSMP